MFFFFSSRRRHTRFDCDWSSDVCSSDLYGAPLTIRHLLNHTSGLRDWGTIAAAAGWPRGSRVHTHDHVLEIVARRSEERRVGKECRSRWWPECLKAESGEQQLACCRVIR